MLIIDITSSKHSDNVVEIMFHELGGDWFVALFPLVDVELDKMKEYYVGKDFYLTKKDYKGRIFAEADKFNV